MKGELVANEAEAAREVVAAEQATVGRGGGGRAAGGEASDLHERAHLRLEIVLQVGRHVVQQALGLLADLRAGAGGAGFMAGRRHQGGVGRAPPVPSAWRGGRHAAGAPPAP